MSLVGRAPARDDAARVNVDQYRVLGSLTVSLRGTPVDLAAPMQLRLLAALLCRTPRPVSVAEALGALWGDDAPPSARKSLQVYVHRLRRSLGEHRIHSRVTGYALTLDPDELDALRFASLFERARSAHRQGLLDDAGKLLEDALGLWRGAAYADVAAGPLVAEEAARLDELRLVAFEELAAVDLERGRYAEVVPRLTDLSTSHPYREHLRGQLMTALYHTGRRAEALEAYRQARRLLAEELGVEPVPQLQRLHESILRGDLPRPSLQRVAPQRVAVTGLPVPKELPRDASAFVGRAEALRVLDESLGGPAVVVTISGMAGVGKTALGVHWAHRVAASFPDGQLFADLRGYAPGPPVRPVEALALFLRALGVPSAEVPVDLDRAVRMYRTLLADRRVLVLLDNAAGAGQVRPLLPGGAGCLALVTSRDLLTGLVARDGARPLVLDVLPPGHSAELVTRVFTGYGLTAPPVQEIAELAEACGHLPLALRIAAANLAERNGASDLSGYVRALRGGRGLDGLEVPGDPETSVRGTLLADTLRTYFWTRRHYSEWLATGKAALAAASRTGSGQATAAVRLSLSLAHRSLGDVLTAITHAAAALAVARDLGWSEAEASALSGLAVAHAESGQTRAALTHLTEAYALARRSGDRTARARLLNNLGTLRHYMGDLRGSLRDALAALAIHEQGDSPGMVALAHCAAGAGYVYLGQYDQAEVHLSRSHEYHERVGERYGQAIACGLLAKLHADSGDLERALTYATTGLAHSRAAKDRSIEATLLTELATVVTRLGRYDEARRHAGEALDLARDVRSCHPEVGALIALAEAHRLAGDTGPALSTAKLAASLAEHREYRLLHADALTSIAATSSGAGRDRDSAVTAAWAALDRYRAAGYPAGAARAETLLANLRALRSRCADR